MDEKNTLDKKYHKQHIRRLTRKMAIIAKKESDTCSTLDKKDEHDDESTRNDDETTRSDDKTTRSDDETTKSNDETTFTLQEHKRKSFAVIFLKIQHKHVTLRLIFSFINFKG